MQSPPPYSSSTSIATSMKIKTLIHNFIFPQLTHVARVLTKAKTALIEIVEETRLNNIRILVPLLSKKNRNKNKLYLGSYRVHYNWSSSHYVPQSSIHYESTSDSFEDDVAPESRLSGYLHWLEEKNKLDIDYEIVEINEIDYLAEKFIANCHGKFVLEKQESDRKFREMMSRSV